MGNISSLDYDKLRESMKKIQLQYDQIMEMARKNQERGIDSLCTGWRAPIAYTTINNAVDSLNKRLDKITLQYQNLFDEINALAIGISSSGGGNGKKAISFNPSNIRFNAIKASDGAGGDDVVFDEDLIINGIGRIKQMSKNVIKNMRDTNRIFEAGIGIRLKDYEFLNTFKTKMRIYANKIDQEVEEIISAVDLKTDEQKEKLDSILSKYSIGSLNSSSSSKISGVVENVSDWDLIN